MGRIILLSMEEVMGRTGVNAVLKLASLPTLIENYPPDNTSLEFPFTTVSNLTEMLEQVYGPHGGRGLAVRVGRACFNYGVRQYGTQMGLTEMAFRLLPLPAKLHAGAKAFAELFNKFTDQQVRVEEEDGQILWHIGDVRSAETQGSRARLSLGGGLLQEALYWVSGGKVFNVEEKTCIAAGDKVCTIVIDQTPIF
jgi:hypothetical protein